MSIILIKRPLKIKTIERRSQINYEAVVKKT